MLSLNKYEEFLAPFGMYILIFLIEYFDPTDLKPNVYLSRDNVQTLSAAYMDRARYWLRECEAKHPDCKAQNPNFMPTRIVHVGTSDLLIPVHLEISTSFRSLNQDRRYCSLSHRWIGVEMELKTTNVEALMEEIPIESLSKASRDAIFVTRHLGLKYLWIDSLCIIQDSPEDWTREAATMAEIYENSVCTIAAAGETTVSCKAAFKAQNPLIHNHCRLGGSWNDGLYVKQFSSGLEGTNGSSLVQHKDLISRGWVYQERILSPKMIFFGDREILWSCRYGKASEEEPDGKSAKKIFGPLVSAEQLKASRNAVRGFSDFERLLQGTIVDAHGVDNFLHTRSFEWYQLISAYTICDLSHEGDRLIALAGLAQRIQSKTGWQYLAGLWRQSLFHDLRWYRTGEAKERSKSYIAPTWSWASVGGNVSWHMLSASHTELEPHPLIDIISVETETHSLDTTSTGKVTSGSLVVHGCLKTAAVFVFPPDWSHYPMHPSEDGLPLMISNYTMVGWLWLDVVFCELERILFMPLISDIFRKHSISSGSRTGFGLALIPKANYYERIGFFSLHASKARDLPQQWLIPGRKEIIVIK
jgi:Heterokaryon incompatibility protein (HET)